MSDAVRELLKAHLKQLRLPAMVQELEALSREAAASNQNYEQFLLRLTEVELAARAAHALQSRIKQADFPVTKDFDTYDFTAMPSLSGCNRACAIDYAAFWGFFFPEPP